MLTNSELKQIKDYLALYAKKDSQLEAVNVDLDYPEVTFEANDYLSVVQDNKNKTIKIKDLEKVFLLTFLTDEDFREALKGKIPEEMLENACVTTEKLADGAVTTIKLGNNAITTAKIATGAITGEKIANNTIQGTAFAANSITTDKIVDGTVTGDKLADGSIQSVDIKDNTLSGSKFVDGSISGSKIQDNVIESKHLLDNSIPASKIKDGSIESIDIKDGTLDGSKIKDNTIESAKLANNAITTDKIKDNSITTSKIANDAVTEDKIVDDSITTAKIANSSVTTDKIVDEAITEDKLANGAVTTAKLADGLISEIQNITDDTPTTGSVKPVQSGGVKTAIDNVAFSTNEKVKNVGIDSEPVAGSDNLVKSGGVKKELVNQELFSSELYDDVCEKIGLPKVELESSSTQTGYALKKDGTTEFISSTTKYEVKLFSVVGEKDYIITGRVREMVNDCLYCFYDSNDVLISYGIPSIGVTKSYQVVVASPSNAEYLRVMGHSTNGTVSVSEYVVSALPNIPFMVMANNKTTYNDDGSIYINALYLKRVNDDSVQSVLIDNTFSPLEGSCNYILSYDDSLEDWRVSVKTTANVGKNDIILLMLNSQHIVFGGALYTDYVKKLYADYTPSEFVQQFVSCSSTTTYNEDTGEIYIGSINLSDYKNGRVIYTFNQSYTPYATTITTSYVLTKEGTIVSKILNELVVSDLVLLTYFPTKKTFIAGLIYPHYLSKKLENVEILNQKIIHPTLKYEQLKRTGTVAEIYCGKNVLSTPKFIEVKKDFTFESNIECLYTVLFFDTSFSLISATEYDTIIPSVSQNIVVPTGCNYIKIACKKDNSATIPIPLIDIKLTGYFGEEVYNIRPSDGYQRIIVPVNVTNPTCCNIITDNVQDSEELLPDYGILALPKQYSNTGEPTRLIIYCHGAAVNYASDVTRFNSVDLEPDYWLAEGYAVMDVEGNPYNNEDEHFYIPQAMECYVAAYKWVIEHYNIRRDGVFLGGRSMGGGMTFNLLRRECSIPIIAACPNATAAWPTCVWNYMSAQRRSFTATHCGFVNQPTWTSTSPMPADEWNCLIENFDKLVRNTPNWNVILDLPGKDVLLDTDFNFGMAEPESSTKMQKLITTMSALHAWVKAPIKFFGVEDDASANPTKGSNIYLKELENAGQITEQRLFQSGGHHYDTQNPNLRTTITTRYGVEMTNIPVVYIEMLQFWRRYEQGN